MSWGGGICVPYFIEHNLIDLSYGPMSNRKCSTPANRSRPEMGHKHLSAWPLY